MNETLQDEHKQLLRKLTTGWVWHSCECPYCELSLYNSTSGRLELVSQSIVNDLVRWGYLKNYGSYSYLLTDYAKQGVAEGFAAPHFYVILPKAVGGRCYLADWGEGDPPRTYVKTWARRFKTEEEAEQAIEDCKEAYRFQERSYQVISSLEDEEEAKQ